MTSRPATIAVDGPLRLRPLRESDLPAHAAGCLDPAIVHWVNGDRVSTDEEHLAWLRRQAAGWPGGADVVDVGVELVDDRGEAALAGIVGIQRGLDYLQEGQVNLTYTLYPQHRGAGLATRAVALVMRAALERWPWQVREFVIRCDPANTASAEVARRLGFTEVGLVAEEHETLLRFVRPAEGD